MTVDAGIVQAVVVVLGLFAVLVVCSLFKSRPTADAFSLAQLSEIRIRREAEKEASNVNCAADYSGTLV